MKICICGGGNLATVCAGFIAARQDAEVSVFTRRPEAWSRELEVLDPEGHCFRGHLAAVSSRAEELVPQADLILLCLPGFAIEPTLQAIRPWLRPDTAVGSVVSSTGFFFFAHDLLPADQPLFGFQRVPFISRIENYGHRAHLLGYKPELSVAIENESHFCTSQSVGASSASSSACAVSASSSVFASSASPLLSLLEQLFRTPMRRLRSFYEASLTNSNPILHTGRLYTLWRDWHGTPLSTPIRFYEEWTDEASACILSMDDELMALTRHLGIDERAVPSLLTYYESTDASSLTRKIRSIAAFQGIQAPMRQTPEGYIPDFQSRYFTEDFPFGLRFIRQLLHDQGIPCPHIDEVFAWGISLQDRA